MKKLVILLGIISILPLTSCQQEKLEKCRAVELEGRERNNLGEVFSEGALYEGTEAEMICGDTIIDLKGGKLKTEFGILIPSFFDESLKDKGFGNLIEETGLIVYTNGKKGGKQVLSIQTHSSDDLRTFKRGSIWNYDS